MCGCAWIVLHSRTQWWLLFPNEAAASGRPQASKGPRLLLGDDFASKWASGESFLMSFETQQRKFVRPVRAQPEGTRGCIYRGDFISSPARRELIAGRLCWTRDTDFT